ncbi:HAD hydrolase family protein [Paenibacillus terrigena]|nr:HAD hydrolase family protein [Paenibacillus terrigena]
MDRQVSERPNPETSFAGLGITIGNAAEGVKRNADQVTLSNDEDGLKH